MAHTSPSPPPPPATETTPLVGAIDEQGTTTSTTSPNTPQIQVQPQSRVSRWSGTVRAHVSKWRVLYLTGILIFIADFAPFMGEASRLRMLELGLCREHYSVVDPSVIGSDGSVAEKLCKAREIQSALARMRGFLALLEYLPGLVLAVPYGILADMRGRKLVLAISLFGIILKDSWFWVVLSFYQTFPLRAVYSASALVVLGGGATVLTATCLAVMAAAIPEDKRLYRSGSFKNSSQLTDCIRTQSFLYLTVTILVSEFLAPPFGSLLLDTIGPHATFLVTIPILFLAFIPIALYPSEARAEARALMRSPETDDVTADQRRFKDILKQRVHNVFRLMRRDVAPFIFQRSIILGISSLAIQKLARPMLQLLLQYMSIKFGWSLSKVSPRAPIGFSFNACLHPTQSAFLTSIQAAAQIVLFVLIVPQLYGWILKRQNDARRANIALAKISVTFLMLGSLFMALAPVPIAFIICKRPSMIELLDMR
jgi:MFS family permease